MANKNRNEFEIQLEGRSLTLRATWSCRTAIEERTGKSFVILSEESGEGRTTFNDCFIIIQEGYKAYSGVIMDDEELQGLLLDTGLIVVALQIQKFILTAGYGGKAFEMIAKHAPVEDRAEDNSTDKKKN